MRYNEKYDRYVTKEGLVYRYSYKQDRLIQCRLTTSTYGYLRVNVSKPKKKKVFVHRLVYETFVGEIPSGYEIDHINTIRTDNSLENLRLVTHKENSNNPLTLKHSSESKKGNSNAKGNTNTRCKTYSEFGVKFKEHFGITNYENPKLYHREYLYYSNHNNTCRWEK